MSEEAKLTALVSIIYDAKRLCGRFSCEPNGQTSAIWTRLQNRAVSTGAGTIGDSSIELQWPEVLNLVREFGSRQSQQNLGFRFFPQGAAAEKIRQFAEELRAVKTVRDTLFVTHNVAEIEKILNDRGFVKRNLKTFQIRDLQHLSALSHGANFSVPGSGKTTVSLALHVLVRKPGQHMLVVCPKSAFPAWRAKPRPKGRFVEIGGEERRDPAGFGPVALGGEKRGRPVLHRASVAVLGQHQAGPAIPERLEVCEGDEHLLILVLAGAVERRAQAVAGRGAGERAEVEVDVLDPLRCAEHEQAFDAPGEQNVAFSGCGHAGLGQPALFQFVAKLGRALGGGGVDAPQGGVFPPRFGRGEKVKDADDSGGPRLGALAQIGHETADVGVDPVAELVGEPLDARAGGRGNAGVIAEGEGNGRAGKSRLGGDEFHGGAWLRAGVHLTGKFRRGCAGGKSKTCLSPTHPERPAFGDLSFRKFPT